MHGLLGHLGPDPVAGNIQIITVSRHKLKSNTVWLRNFEHNHINKIALPMFHEYLKSIHQESGSHMASQSRGTSHFFTYYGPPFIVQIYSFHNRVFHNNKAILGNGNTIFGIRGKFSISSCPQSL